MKVHPQVVSSPPAARSPWKIRQSATRPPGELHRRTGDPEREEQEQPGSSCQNDWESCWPCSVRSPNFNPGVHNLCLHLCTRDKSFNSVQSVATAYQSLIQDVSRSFCNAENKLKVTLFAGQNYHRMASICCTRCGAVFKRTVMGSVPQKAIVESVSTL